MTQAPISSAFINASLLVQKGLGKEKPRKRKKEQSNSIDVGILNSFFLSGKIQKKKKGKKRQKLY